MRLSKKILAGSAAAFLAVVFAPVGSAQILFDSGGQSYVAYNFSTDYVSNSNGDFSATYYTTFATADFDPAAVLASFGVTLTDATRGGTGVTVSNLIQTATLSLVIDNSVVTSTNLANADLTLPTLSAPDRSTTTESTETPGFPSLIGTGVFGDYNELTVTVSGTLSNGAELGTTGVVDTEVSIPIAAPEPSSWMLAVFATLVFGASVHRKRVL
jgi:hypothetical protein